MDEVTCKKCSNCQQYKPLNCFTNETKSPDGKQYYCKDCKSKYQAKYMPGYLKDKGDEQSLRCALWALTKFNVLDVDLEEYLGCSKEIYKAWITYQFEPWMTFENYGRETWHVDHVLPVSKTENKYICWNWINLRPLDASENRTKMADVDYELYFNQIENAIDFIQQLKPILVIPLYHYYLDQITKAAIYFYNINGWNHQRTY